MVALGGGSFLSWQVRASAPLGLLRGLVLPHDRPLDIPHLERKHEFSPSPQQLS